MLYGGTVSNNEMVDRMDSRRAYCNLQILALGSCDLSIDQNIYFGHDLIKNGLDVLPGIKCKSNEHQQKTSKLRLG